MRSMRAPVKSEIEHLRCGERQRPPHLLLKPPLSNLLLSKYHKLPTNDGLTTDLKIVLGILAMVFPMVPVVIGTVTLAHLREARLCLIEGSATRAFIMRSG